MHSSRMRTGRSLTVYRSLLLWGGVCSWGVSAPGGYLLLGGGGVSAPGGCLLLGLSALGGCLLWGVSAPGAVCSGGGVSALGGCLVPGGVCSGGSAPGGVSAPRGVSGIPICTETDTPPPCGQNHRRL